MDIQKSNINAQKVSFSGHKKFNDKTGFENHKFYYLYDSQKYDCEVELYNIRKDKNLNLLVENEGTPAAALPLENGSVSACIPDVTGSDNELGFAYRFKLTDKETGEESYAFDNGTVYNIHDTENTDNKYNIILNNRATINKNGPMQLIMPDEYYPGVENVDGKPRINEALRSKALTSVRTHANKLGGNFFGIVERLPEIKKEGITRIVGTPFTQDTISSHLYWTENAYRTAPGLGNEEEFKTLQTELFKNGINWISDAALVNEGFGGIHLSELLRKGQDSISKNMFRADERISLGILPENSKFTRMKIINAPFTVENNQYVPKNPDYNPGKPTYIQFYDERLASPEQVKSDSPARMSSYDIKNTDNIYDITKHDDAVYPFPVEVSPSELERNVKRISRDKGKVDFSDIETIKNTADFKNFNVVEKSKNAGLEVWDGNVDIAKLNFYRNPKDYSRFNKLPEQDRMQAIEDFDRGTLAVRDYALNSGKYWTELTSAIQLKHASSLFDGKCYYTEDYMQAIKDLTASGELPDSALEVIDEDVIDNVLIDDYNLRTLYKADIRSGINPEVSKGNDYTESDYILKKAMDVPFETLPFSSNLLGVITSPYIAKKANTEEELCVSRYDTYKAGNPSLPEKYSNVYTQAEDLYTEKIVPLIEEALSDVPEIKDEDGNITDYGRYVVSEAAPDLTKYLLIKSVDVNANIPVDSKGNFDFTKVNPEEMTMQSVGIPYEGKSSEQEAQMLVDVMNKGLDEIETDDLKSKLAARFENRTLDDFKVAEMILDRTESGLGWRIDAAKDIASIDAVRSDSASMTETWNNVIKFWKQYNDTVLDVNPHAYTTAEITDLYDLFANEDKSVFTSDADAERKFLQETGITAVANYNYFFSLLPELFMPYNAENGAKSWQAEQGKNFQLREKFDQGWSGTNPGFLFQSPDDGVVNSYTFVGNHDKPRILHNLSLDMELFTSDVKLPEYPQNEIDEIEKELDETGKKRSEAQDFISREEEEALDAEEENLLKRKESIIENYNNRCELKTNHRERVAEVLQKDVKDIDFDKVSSKAAATGERLNIAFASCISDPDTLQVLADSVSRLASGQFKGKSFDADAFGTRPFEVAIKSVFDDAEYNGNKIKNREKLEADTLQSILTPAYDRYFSIAKLLMTIPGSPTDFAGDKEGATGFETKAKNYHQQNRNIIHWEWLKNKDDNRYKFIKTFHDTLSGISNLRTRPELSALNDGATVTLFSPEEQWGGVQSMLRYNDKGSVVLTVHDMSGSNAKVHEPMMRKDHILESKIILNAKGANAKQGLKHGIEPGTKFKNARDDDKSVYKFVDSKDGYVLKRFSVSGNELPIQIKPEDFNTLVLYKVN